MALMQQDSLDRLAIELNGHNVCGLGLLHLVLAVERDWPQEAETLLVGESAGIGRCHCGRSAAELALSSPPATVAVLLGLPSQDLGHEGL
eukprot:12022793-Alexandrium_andersonii.AAC.1